MNYLRTFILVMFIFCIPVFCDAQKGRVARELVKNGMKEMMEDATAEIFTEETKQNIMRQVFVNPVARYNAQQAILKMESEQIADLPVRARQLFQSNAFLVEVDYKGQKEIWGVSTRELMDGFGKKLTLKKTIKGKEISIPAQVVNYGPYALSNISLLRVPQQLPEGLKPLQISLKYDLKDPVSIFGYNKGLWYEMPSLTLQKDNGLFLRMDFSKHKEQTINALGAPVLSQKGNLIGVFCSSSWTGGYASSIKMLPKMIEAAHGGSDEFPFQMRDVFFGNIRLSEVILSIQALDNYGKIIHQMISPKEIHQSSIFHMLNQKETRFLRFLLEDRPVQEKAFDPENKLRWLVYDKETKRHFFIDN